MFEPLVRKVHFSQNLSETGGGLERDEQRLSFDSIYLTILLLIGAREPREALVRVAAQGIYLWLRASGVTTGPIFRRIRKTKAVEPLSGQAVGLIVKRRAQLAGLEGNFGAHSLRSGLVTEARRQNVPIEEAMGLTGHRSLVTFMLYFRTGAVQHTRAARVFDGPDAPED